MHLALWVLHMHLQSEGGRHGAATCLSALPGLAMVGGVDERAGKIHVIIHENEIIHYYQGEEMSLVKISEKNSAWFVGRFPRLSPLRKP